MKKYELAYFISPEISGEEAEGLAKQISSFVEEQGGKIIKTDNPSPKTLSYPIKRQGSGFFTLVEFEIEPEKLAAIKDRLDKDTKVLRSTIVVKNPVKAMPERRTPKAPSFTKAESVEETPVVQETPAQAQEEEKKTEKKIELNDIEKKLDEILGE